MRAVKVRGTDWRSLAIFSMRFCSLGAVAKKQAVRMVALARAPLKGPILGHSVNAVIDCKGSQMAKPNYAFAKRQRDLAQKQKKEEKKKRKAEASTDVPADGTLMPQADVAAEPEPGDGSVR
jgi:hypothetical protein